MNRRNFVSTVLKAFGVLFLPIKFLEKTAPEALPYLHGQEFGSNRFVIKDTWILKQHISGKWYLIDDVEEAIRNGGWTK